MKKLIFTTILLYGIQMFALSQIQYGVTAGKTFSNYHFTIDSDKINTKNTGGYTGGVFANFPLAKTISFSTGLNYVQKGFIIEEDENSLKSTIHLVELPVQLLYHTNNIKDGLGGEDLMMAIGPTFSYALQGKYVEKSNGEKVEEKMSFGNANDDAMKPFDVGANIMMGVQLKSGLLFQLNYNTSLSNLLPQADKDHKLNSSCWALKLGYAF